MVDAWCDVPCPPCLVSSTLNYSDNTHMQQSKLAVTLQTECCCAVMFVMAGTCCKPGSTQSPVSRQCSTRSTTGCLGGHPCTRGPCSSCASQVSESMQHCCCLWRTNSLHRGHAPAVRGVVVLGVVWGTGCSGWWVVLCCVTAQIEANNSANTWQ